MSDHLLVGLAPTAPQGRELFFHCLDTWIDLQHIIIMIMVLGKEKFNLRTPEGAIQLAKSLQGTLDDGSAEELLQKIARESFTGRGCKEEREEYVINMRVQAEKLIEFLLHSGGMKSG